VLIGDATSALISNGGDLSVVPAPPPPPHFVKRLCSLRQRARSEEDALMVARARAHAWVMRVTARLALELRTRMLEGETLGDTMRQVCGFPSPRFLQAPACFP